MTVFELIQILKNFNQNLIVYVDPDRNTSAPVPTLELSEGGLDPYPKGKEYVRL